MNNSVPTTSAIQNLVPRADKTRKVEKPASGTQAERIYAKFGGASKLCKAMVDAGVPRVVSAIYRWNLPRSHGGTDGLIPSSALPDVLKAARLYGIVITPEDLFPSS